ncbi:hypothetical protein [Phocaeicola dorei]|uniref:hypothetical protein n=1 Tax=Phocaeicola dorei TaxID=357276 RepID=UPI00319E31D7
MYNSIHSKFIKTPISTILKDGVNACFGIGYGIETYPLCDYIMQSLFLKMTGAQEQKLKCICWEMATYDYVYRRAYLDKVKSDYGEFSTYEQKNNVYKQIIHEIKNYNNNFEIENFRWIKNIDAHTIDQLFDKEVSKRIEMEIEKQSRKKELDEENKNNIRASITKICNDNKEKIIIEITKRKFVTNVKEDIASFLETSILSIGGWRNYSFWKEEQDCINSLKCALKGTLLKENLKELYENDVIKHRHRCAHNLTSYQQNLPTLDMLSQNGYSYHNYFFRFAILVLIDEIFIRLYEKYIEEIENNFYNIEV